MTDVKLSVPERALLFILMSRNGELSNPQIEKEYAPGLRLTGKDRLKLVDAKLIESRKGERGAYFFSLADGGWAWCREELKNREVPRAAGAAGQALYALFGGLDQYLERTGRSLAQVFGGQPEATGPQPEATGQAEVAVAVTPADEIEKSIRRAYRSLAKPNGDWVGLADLRDELGGLGRAEVDGVLRLMTRLPGVRIEEETNQKALEPRDRAAAVVIGNRDQHVLAIEDL
ncbi:hypothetical protein [Actinoplanes sp. NPDC051851]|uniref:hypothetical protein n=1 Tax=Actinoplanes sp. NPDC051851 TaxID=3154753 RepID=UPI00344AFF08